MKFPYRLTPILLAMTVAACSPAPPPQSDSDSLISSETHEFLQDLDSSASAEVIQNDSIVLTMDTDTYTTLTEQDKSLTKEGLYNKWRRIYMRHHDNVQPTSAVLLIKDLSGTTIDREF